MISKRTAAVTLALVALMFAAGLMALAHDARTAVPIHAAGVPDDALSPAAAYLTMPGIAAGVWLVLALAP